MLNQKPFLILRTTALLLCLCLLPFTSVPAKAEPVSNFENPEYVIDKSFRQKELYMNCNDKLSVYHAKSSDPKVAVIDTVYNTGVSVRATGVGEATIHFYDGAHRKSSAHWYTTKVIVTKEGLVAALKNVHCIEDGDGVDYGARKIKIYGEKGTTYKIKVNGKSLKGIKNGTGTFKKAGARTVTLPKALKIGTRISYEVSYPYTAGGALQKPVTFSSVAKVKARSLLSEASLLSGKKKIRLSLENVHKGDVFTLTHRGKTYRMKINRDYPRDDGNYNFTLKLKKTMTKSSKFTVCLTNQFSQTLQKKTIKLKGGRYWAYGDD